MLPESEVGVTGKLDRVADTSVAQRLRVALDLYQFGEEMQRSRLRRERPDATEEELKASVRAWRCSRPGAPQGDAAGRSARRFT